MGNSKKGLLAPPFNRAVQTGFTLILRKKLAAFAMALPMLAMPGYAAANDTEAPQDQTRHSRQIDEHQRKYEYSGTYYTHIIFIDRDEIHRRAALADSHLTREKAMQHALRSYIVDRTGQQINEGIIASLVESLESGGGQAQPVYYSMANETTGEPVSQAMCVITGQNPDMTRESRQFWIMGLSSSYHDDLMKRPMLRNLAPDVLQRYTDYHELGHCSDPYYMQRFIDEPDLSSDLGEGIVVRHKTELFAEVFATLMLARDGVNNVAGIRADHRLVSLALNGYLLSRQAAFDPISASLGYVYALHEGLWLTQREIDRIGLENIQRMTPEELVVLAGSIVERDPLSNRTAEHATSYLVQEKFDLKTWERLRHEMPIVEARYRIAVRVRDQVTEAFKRVYGPDAFNPNFTVVSQLPFDGPAIKKAPETPIDRGPLIKALKQQLLAEAGGERATPESLIRATVREKERLRALLDGPGPDDLKARAVINLTLMSQAMREIVLQMRGDPAPVPAVNDNAPARELKSAPLHPH